MIVIIILIFNLLCSSPLAIILLYMSIIVAFKRLVTETPYLIHSASKAPHITGSGVLLVVNSLGNIIYFMCMISVHSAFISTSGAVHLTGTIPPRET